MPLQQANMNEMIHSYSFNDQRTSADQKLFFLLSQIGTT